jgi:hypothetical protein
MTTARQLTATAALFLTVSPAMAAPQIPDPNVVTNISEAAKLCEFDQVGVRWIEKSSNTISISITAQELTDPAGPIVTRLKECFFGWAYERSVKVEFVGREN